jgi:predicted PurR-regulated permease PerM
MKLFILFILFCVSATLQTATNSFAVEIAPRMSDREIIESLTELKAGQVQLNQRIDSMEKRITERFEASDKQFESIDKRFESIDKRFENLTNIVFTLFGAMISLIIAIFAYIAWDRRTMMHPIQARLQALEADIAHDLDLSHKQGSRLTRLLEVFRSMAKTDPKIAEALRSLSLL